MSINSISYILFILIAVAIYYIVPKKARWLVLLISNYIFYILASSKLTIFLLISTISIYIGGLLIGKENNKLNIDIPKEEKKLLKQKVKKTKKRIVFTTVLINFGLLATLKYINFFSSGINAILDLINIPYQIPLFKWLLPLGISYYTLQAVSYIVDVYRDKYEASKSFKDVALYLSFFPTITEGPIGKFDELKDELNNQRKFNINNFCYGATLILLGFFQKMVIADRAGIFVNEALELNPGGITIFLIAIMYTIQIYTEFEGCMKIVTGSAKLFNINVASNFNQPFFSKNIQEFWQRWHITLGAWIKEYIFYPVSLSKMSTKVTQNSRKHLPASLAKFIAVAFPLLFVWLFNGIWHGASIKYIAYGMYYYIIMMIGLLISPSCEKLLKKLKIDKEKTYYKIFQILRTCFFVIFGMLLFRSADIKTFALSIAHIFTKKSLALSNISLINVDYLIILISILIIAIIGYKKEKGVNVYEKFNNTHWTVKFITYLIIIITIVVFGIYGPGYNVSDFIYGGF